MAKTKYSSFIEINEFQRTVMIFIDRWVREKKTPVPRKEIMKAFTGAKKDNKHPAISVEWSINALLRTGYIRKAYSGDNKTYYVQLRNL